MFVPSNFPVLARAHHKISSRNTWTARRSKQSILKEIDAEYSLEGLTLKLTLQYFGHLMQTGDSLEKTIARKD